MQPQDQGPAAGTAVPPGNPSRQRIISDFVPAQPRSPQQVQRPMPAPAISGPAINPLARPQTAAAPLQPQPTSPSAPLSNTESTPEPAPARHESFAKPELPAIEPREKPQEKSAWRDVLSIGGVLVSALLLAFVLISFVFQSYQVDGPSMQTTLENNDHLIVWKVPKTFANLTGKAYIPNRGDVVIFSEPGLDGSAEDKQLIKRVLALPGERVVVKDNIVTVFNNENPNGFQPDKTLPYGSAIITTPGNVDVTVGEDQVFVCGDNRTNSLDSRVFGPINSSQIIGKLVLRVLPLNTIKAF